jgi:VanZ family protein
VSGRRSAAAPRVHWFDGIVLVLVLGILYASLARYGELDCGRALQNFLREGNHLSGSDALANVFAYLLLGAALGVAWQLRQPRRSAAAGPPWGATLLAVSACALLSLSMEAVQACLTDRVSAYWDVFNNTLGGALGWFAVRLLQPVWTSVHGRSAGGPTRGRLLAVVALTALAWLTAETAPWVPTTDVGVIRQNLKAVWVGLGSGYLDPWRLVARLSEWLALGLALALPLRHPPRAILPFATIAVAAIGLRMLLQGTSPPSPELMLTLPVAALMMIGLPRLGLRTCAALAIVGATVAVLAYQLEPGNGVPQAFRWRLLILQGNPIGGIQLAAYFGWYALTVVAAGHVLTGRALVWLAPPVLLLAATEWAQTLLPGRNPELSPPLVALACGALAAGMLAGARRPRR